MCGFVGGLLRSTLEPKRLDRALAALHHRGPDAVGRWVAPDGRWFLGHTRLSILGLDNGSQPIADATVDVQIVVNGEFYGYKAIRERLRAEGCAFTTDSDIILTFLSDRIEMAHSIEGRVPSSITRSRSMRRGFRST